jgi:hypothetical protein
MPVNRYHNLSLVRDGSASQKIYQNGILIGTGNVSNSFSTGTLHLAAAPAGGATYAGYLNGNISNILRYNRALSNSEILQNYNATRTRFGL